MLKRPALYKKPLLLKISIKLFQNSIFYRNIWSPNANKINDDFHKSFMENLNIFKLMPILGKLEGFNNDHLNKLV